MINIQACTTSELKCGKVLSFNKELDSLTVCIFHFCYRKGGGVFWKLLGLTLTGAGGVVAYAWYDADFRKTVEDNVPYSKDALSLLYQYLPPVPDTKAPAIELPGYVVAVVMLNFVLM